MPRLFADDATPEALAGLLARHGRIGIIAAESALLDNLAGRYSEGPANLHLVCQAYSGEETSVDRRNRDPERLDRPLLALGLAIQPHVLRTVRENEQMREQGLLARLSYSLPRTRLGHRAIDAPSVPSEVADAYDEAIRRIATLNPRDRSDRTVHPPDQRWVLSLLSPGFGDDVPKLSWSPEAAASFRELRARHEPRLHPAHGDLGRIAAWAGRHPGRVARFAGLLHLVEHGLNEPIAAETLEAAACIGEYLVPHALAALGADERADQRRHVLDWIARRGEATVTVRDLNRGPLRESADAAREMAVELCQLGYLRELPGQKPTPVGGRPPSPIYAVHPDYRNPKEDVSDER
jgi:replicative DNA helicase